jgi:hypothetical protein
LTRRASRKRATGPTESQADGTGMVHDTSAVATRTREADIRLASTDRETKPHQQTPTERLVAHKQRTERASAPSMRPFGRSVISYLTF